MDPFSFALALDFLRWKGYENLLCSRSVEETDKEVVTCWRSKQLEAEPGLKSKSAQALFFPGKKAKIKCFSSSECEGKK